MPPRNLTNLANEYAAERAAVCEDGLPTNPEADEFSFAVARKEAAYMDEPAYILSLWEDKFNSTSWPDNAAFSQAIWRQTEYLGCSDAVTPRVNDIGKRCAYR